MVDRGSIEVEIIVLFLAEGVSGVGQGMPAFDGYFPKTTNVIESTSDWIDEYKQVKFRHTCVGLGLL